jgi:chitinase
MSPFNIKNAALCLLSLPFLPMRYVDAYDANHGEDSRLIAYVGNWQQCPTDDQVDAYSHIVIAFAVSYTWTPEQNNCNQQCQVPSSLPTCENQARPDLIQKWRNMGKKVIVSFGGAGMGGSWSGKLTLYLYY